MLFPSICIQSMHIAQRLTQTEIPCDARPLPPLFPHRRYRISLIGVRLHSIHQPNPFPDVFSSYLFYKISFGKSKKVPIFRGLFILAKKLENCLRLLICLTEHRLCGLAEDVVLREVHHLFRHVYATDARFCC